MLRLRLVRLSVNVNVNVMRGWVIWALLPKWNGPISQLAHPGTTHGAITLGPYFGRKHRAFLCHRIGWWENLQETPIFDGKNHGFPIDYTDFPEISIETEIPRMDFAVAPQELLGPGPLGKPRGFPRGSPFQSLEGLFHGKSHENLDDLGVPPWLGTYNNII